MNNVNVTIIVHADRMGRPDGSRLRTTTGAHVSVTESVPLCGPNERYLHLSADEAIAAARARVLGMIESGYGRASEPHP